MSESTQDLLTILRWAAGADVDVSGIPPVDAARLLHLISRHKLQLRFFERAKVERPPWYIRAVSVPLWQACRTIRAQTQHQIDALCQITAALPASSGPPLLIKGFTAYALTGEERMMRPSADMDLFFPDLAEAKTALLRLGYLDINTPRADHEALRMARDNTLVDIHQFCPVRAYPPDLDIRGSDAGEPGWAAQTAEVLCLTSKIEYADLRSSAVQLTSARSTFYWVADLQMAALIFCTHIFRDYIERCGVQLITPIPLAEIADLDCLVQQPGFDSAMFLALTEKHGAQHSVETASCMLEACFGRSLLPLPKTPSLFQTRHVFPQCLNWSIGIWAVPGPGEELPIREMSMAFEGLGGANKITVSESFSAVHTAGSAAVSHILVRDKDGKFLPLRFSVAWTGDALLFDIHLPPMMADDEDFIKINFGDGQDCCWKCRGTEETLAHHYGILRGNASVTRRTKGHTVRLSLPWPEIATVTGGRQELLLTLSVERWQEKTSTLVPLHLVRS